VKTGIDHNIISEFRIEYCWQLHIFRASLWKENTVFYRTIWCKGWR